MPTLPPTAVERVTHLLCDADGNLFPSEEPAFDASVEVTNAFLASLGIGPVRLAPWTVARALAGGGDETARIIVREIRLPRAVLGFLAGATVGYAVLRANLIPARSGE